MLALRSPSASALHSFEVVRTETCARLEEMRDSGSIENASQIAFHMLGYSATSVSIACKHTLLEPLAALSLLGPRALHAALCCSTFASRAGLTAGLNSCSWPSPSVGSCAAASPRARNRCWTHARTRSLHARSRCCASERECLCVVAPMATLPRWPTPQTLAPRSRHGRTRARAPSPCRGGPPRRHLGTRSPRCPAGRWGCPGAPGPGRGYRSAP